VKSVGDRVKNIFKKLEETFLRERVRKREHQMQENLRQHQTNRQLAIAEIDDFEIQQHDLDYSF
jgi:hypothetical protein